jgi:hypothetical protein
VDDSIDTSLNTLGFTVVGVTQTNPTDGDFVDIELHS